MKDLIIADTVVDVPTTRANEPKIINNEFFTIITNFEIPDLVLTKTKLSIIAGSTMPSKDRQKAPNNDMNRSNFGIATASKTEMKRRIEQNIESQKYSSIGLLTCENHDCRAQNIFP